MGYKCSRGLRPAPMSSSSGALIPPTSGREDGRENTPCSSTSVATTAISHHPSLYYVTIIIIIITTAVLIIISAGECIENCVTYKSLIVKLSADVVRMCHAVLIQLMEVTATTDSFASTTSQNRPNSILRVQQQQQHCDDNTTTTTSSPVPLVLALANAGKRVFEPQRVISDYHADILRFASPSNAFIKTYGIIYSLLYL